MSGYVSPTLGGRDELRERHVRDHDPRMRTSWPWLPGAVEARTVVWGTVLQSSVASAVASDGSA